MKILARKISNDINEALNLLIEAASQNLREYPKVCVNLQTDVR